MSFGDAVDQLERTEGVKAEAAVGAENCRAVLLDCFRDFLCIAVTLCTVSIEQRGFLPSRKILIYKCHHSLAERYEVSYQMAKYHMIELGYCEAGGIRNYVNDMVIPDPGYTWLWPANTIFTISAKDAALLAVSDSEFERVICSGRYRYVEGYFCLNTDKYILRDYYGKPHLTVYARCHMEECCLGFTVGGRYRRIEYAVSKVARNKIEPVTDKYRAAYRLVVEPGSSEYEKENKAMVDDGLLWLEFYKNIPDDFAEMIKEIMKRKGITQENLSFELGVDRKALVNYLNQDRPSVAHVVGICVALKVPYFISMEILGGGRPA